MAISADTFTAAAGASNDLFKGFGDLASSDLKAKGLNLDASGLRIKAQGDLAEASNYDLAAGLANENEQFTVASTAIKQAQLARSVNSAIGTQQSQVAGAGFAASGSALDLLRDSASQGSIAKSVANDQGMITEAGYQEQAQSYQTLATAGRAAAAGEMDIANQTDQLASETKSAGMIAGAGDFISSAIKGAAALAPLLAL